MSQHVPPDPTVGLPAVHSHGGNGGSAASANVDSPGPVNVAPIPGEIAELSALPPIRLRDAQGEDPTPVALASSANPAAERDPTGRLQFQGEIARGGMGAVLKGHDSILGRDIAVKVLLHEHQANADFAQRFVEEAQITGQLQHPGIVPVYELGRFRDQRPFFTMKLVKGKTLAAMLAARKSPAEERAKFVGIFAQVCQTLAYAHARGVIHRDLKPSNIMVGAFGEVQVMDWGLAKVLREGGVADEKKAPLRPDVSVIRTQRSATASGSTESSAYTQVGSLLGTPSYLAPEQARGDVELVDERADVFGLGAILCEVLTGSPPYTGRGAETARKAQTAKLDEAWERLDASEADAELVAVAKRCLAVETWDRPRNAGAVAQEIAAYQNSVDVRLRQAELAHAAEAARAEEALHTATVAKAKAKAERRSMRLALALAASILVAAGLVAVGLRRIELDNISRATALNARVNAALQEAMRQRGQAQGAKVGNLAPWAAALTAARQAETLLESGTDPALREQVQTLLAEVNTGSRQAETQAQAAEAEAQATERDRLLLDRLVDVRSAKEDDSDGSLTDVGYADAFREANLDLEAVVPAQAASTLSSRPRAVVVELAAYIDDWTEVRRQRRKDEEGASRLAALAQALDPDPWRQQLRESIARTDQDKLAALQELSKKSRADNLGPISLNLLGQALNAGGDAAEAEKVLRFAQQRHPDDVWLNYDLAVVLVRLGRRPEAVRYYTAARALRPETAHMLAHALQDAGEHDDAIRVFEELTRLQPNNGRHLACFSSALRSRGRNAEAETTSDAAIVALREQIERTPNVATLHNSLGIAYGNKKELDDAIAAYRRALAVNSKITAPRNNLHRALRLKVTALKDSGKIDEAIAVHREAVDLDPKDVASHEDFVNFLKAQGRLDEAIAGYRKALEVDPQLPAAVFGLGVALRAAGKFEEAITAFAEATKSDPNLTWVQDRLAHAYRENGQIDAAIAVCRKMIERAPRSPGNYYNLGTLLVTKGNAEEAISAFRKATELGPSVATGFYSLGNALNTKGQAEEAIAAYRRAIELEPTVAIYHNALATLYRTGRRFEEAIASYKKAVEADPKSATYQYNLGLALQGGGQAAQSITAFRKAVEVDPKYWSAHDGLVSALKTDQRLDQLIAEYRQALDGAPSFAPARFGLGVALRKNGQLEDAIAAYRQAIEADPKLVWLHNDLAYALRDGNQLPEAVAEFRKTVELSPTSATYHNRLGLMLRANNQLDESITAHRKAIELDPRVAAYHNDLGLALRASGRVVEAIAAYRSAIELSPNNAVQHNNIGFALNANGELDEAIAAYRRSMELDPKYQSPRGNIQTTLLAKGQSLQDKGKLDDALACYREAVEFTPQSTTAHNRLNALLKSKGQLDRIIADYRHTLVLDPKNAVAGFGLPSALSLNGQFEEAIAAYRQTVELNPTVSRVHNGLGLALRDNGQLKEAIAAYRKAIELDSKIADFHNNLGLALRDSGQLDEAIAAHRKAIELGPKVAGYHSNLGLAQSAQGQAQEAMAAFRQALALQPDAFVAHHDLAGLLFKAGKYVEAAAHFQGAAAARPKEVNLYEAACCAALAAAGKDTSAGPLDDSQRADWRRQSLDWMRASLKQRTIQLDQAKTADQEAIFQPLRDWQQDANLASLRDAEALQKLPAEEQVQWRKLWADVAELLHRAPATVSP